MLVVVLVVVVAVGALGAAVPAWLGAAAGLTRRQGAGTAAALRTDVRVAFRVQRRPSGALWGAEVESESPSESSAGRAEPCGGRGRVRDRVQSQSQVERQPIFHRDQLNYKGNMT